MNEKRILEAIKTLLNSNNEVYGYQIVQELEKMNEYKLTGYGTLYNVLEKLEEKGVLTSRVETTGNAIKERRRRYYKLTEKGK